MCDEETVITGTMTIGPGAPSRTVTLVPTEWVLVRINENCVDWINPGSEVVEP